MNWFIDLKKIITIEVTNVIKIISHIIEINFLEFIIGNIFTLNK